MEIKIANKKYTLYFGWDFLEQINKHFGVTMDVSGQEINTKTGGLAFMSTGLGVYDPVTVQKVIQAATNTESQKPAVVNIRKVIEDKMSADITEYKKFVDELADEIKKEPLLQAMEKLNA